MLAEPAVGTGFEEMACVVLVVEWYTPPVMSDWLAPYELRPSLCACTAAPSMRSLSVAVVTVVVIVVLLDAELVPLTSIGLDWTVSWSVKRVTKPSRAPVHVIENVPLVGAGR